MRIALQGKEHILFLCTVVILVFMGMGVVAPVLPLYAQSFGAGAAMVGLVVAAYGLARVFADYPVGQLADRLGRRPLIVYGTLLFMITSFLGGLTTDLVQLILFRFFQGASSAMYTTAAMAALSDMSTREDRARVLSYYQGAMLFGSGLGPPVGGFVAQYFGYRAPFFFTAVLALIAAIWAWWRIPETKGFYHPETEGYHEEQSVSPREGFLDGIKPFLANTNFVLAASVSFCIHFMNSGVRLAILPLLGKNQLLLTEFQIGLAMAIISMMDFVTIFVSGSLADRWGRKMVIIPGMTIAGLALVFLALSSNYGFFLLAAVIFGLGRGISGPAPMAFAVDNVPQRSFGRTSGIYRTLSDMGFIAGPLASGLVADMSDLRWALVFNAAIVLLITTLFGLLAKEKMRKQRAEEVPLETFV